MNKPLYPTVLPGKFIDRPNRFIAHVEVQGKIATCHMPNPGRMRELLFPGCQLYVTPSQSAAAKTAYRVIGVEKERTVFFLDTSKCNDVAAYLVQAKRIPGWESYVLLRREVTMGDSRFDLLLGNPETGEVFPVEVKSCSLSGQKGAMFPDAPTERGTKHLQHLARIGKEGGHAGLLVLVHDEKAQWFLPDFHTDPDFARTFYESMAQVDWKAAVISWTPDFTMPETCRLIPTSSKALQEEMGDRGNYLLTLRLPEEQEIEWEGQVFSFSAGYYVYVGKATDHLSKQCQRYRNVRKRKLDILDVLRSMSQWVGTIPIRTKEDVGALAAKGLQGIADWGVSDVPGISGQQSLFGFHQNPMHVKEFTLLEEELMINRLDRYFE